MKLLFFKVTGSDILEVVSSKSVRGEDISGEWNIPCTCYSTHRATHTETQTHTHSHTYPHTCSLIYAPCPLLAIWAIHQASWAGIIQRGVSFSKSPISLWAVCSPVPSLCPLDVLAHSGTGSQYSRFIGEELNFLIHLHETGMCSGSMILIISVWGGGWRAALEKIKRGC